MVARYVIVLMLLMAAGCQEEEENLLDSSPSSQTANDKQKTKSKKYKEQTKDAPFSFTEVMNTSRESLTFTLYYDADDLSANTIQWAKAPLLIDGNHSSEIFHEVEKKDGVFRLKGLHTLSRENPYTGWNLRNHLHFTVATNQELLNKQEFRLILPVYSGTKDITLKSGESDNIIGQEWTSMDYIIFRLKNKTWYSLFITDRMGNTREKRLKITLGE